MIENWNYISDEELERLINQVEQEELVAAPPDLLERILEAEQEIFPRICGEAASGSEEATKQIPNICFSIEVTGELEVSSAASSVVADREIAEGTEVSSVARITEADKVAAGASAAATKVTTVSMAVARKKEFYAYCFRVITSVAAAVALVFLLPELTNRMNLNEISISGHYDKSTKVQNSPSCNEVVMPLSSKAEVAEGNTAPSKAEVTEGNATPSKAEVAEGSTTPNKAKVVEGNTTPSKAEIMAVELIPSKAEVVKAKAVPSKEEVLQDTGFIGKIIGSGWFNKESDTQY